MWNWDSVVGRRSERRPTSTLFIFWSNPLGPQPTGLILFSYFICCALFLQSMGLLGKIAGSTHNTPHNSSIVASISFQFECDIDMGFLVVIQVVGRLLRLLLVGRTLQWQLMGRKLLFLKVFWGVFLLRRLWNWFGIFKNRFRVNAGLRGGRSNYTQVCMNRNSLLVLTRLGLDFAIMTGEKPLL